MNTKHYLVSPSAAVLLAVGLIAGTGIAMPDTEAGPEETQASSPAESLSFAFRRVAQDLRPSVVRVTSVVERPFDRINGLGRLPFSENPPLNRLEKGNPNSAPFSIPDALENDPVEGHGTGLVIDARGYIVTNYHVIRGARDITVTLHDERTVVAEVFATDEKTDLAVLRVDADDLVPARFGDSDAAEVGDWVLAIGSPFGLDQSVTAGIVSAKGRCTIGLAAYEDFIQTDASINPGNSGGPLLNLQGEVIGINTAIASSTGGNMGIGFAIPSRLVQQVTSLLISDGVRIDSGESATTSGRDSSRSDYALNGSARLGIYFEDPSMRWEENRVFAAHHFGCLIADVDRGSPAERAGLQRGDAVISVDGHSVDSAEEFTDAMRDLEGERSVKILILRDSMKQFVDVTVREEW